MVLRIATDDSKSSTRLSVKFGAPLKSCRRLLEMANNLNVDVIGVRYVVLWEPTLYWGWVVCVIYIYF